MLFVKWCIALTFIWFGSFSFVSGDKAENGKIILPAYMDPPSANQSPKCLRWIQSIFLIKPPATRDQIKTNFHLYTRQNTESGIPINPSDRLTRGFQKIRKTVVITQGFRLNKYEEWAKQMTKAFLDKEDVKVITVNWQKGATTWIQAVSYAKVVGAEVALLLKYLHNNFKMPFSSFHLVGHSLGTQISSYVSYHVGGKIGRLTALDPASPCLEDVDKDMRVDPSDADFVDVIHTNGKDSTNLGLEKPVSHVDFYPNGGMQHPGCGYKMNSIHRRWNIQLKKFLAYDAVCSHSMACDYFIESIKVKQCTFWGHRWDQESVRSNNVSCDYQSCTPMGFDSGKFPARGVFYMCRSKMVYRTALKNTRLTKKTPPVDTWITLTY